MTIEIDPTYLEYVDAATKMLMKTDMAAFVIYLGNKGDSLQVKFYKDLYKAEQVYELGKLGDPEFISLTSKV